MTRYRRAFLPLLLCATIAPLEPLSPQAPVQAGRRIRVTHRCTTIEANEALLCQPRRDARQESTTGAFIAVRSDTLVLGRSVAPAIELFPRTSVSRVEVTSGRRSHWITGAGIGALTGMVAGAVVGYVATQGDESGITVAIFPVLGAILGTSAGLCTGAAIGLFVKTDRWTPVHVWGGSRILISGRLSRFPP